MLRKLINLLPVSRRAFNEVMDIIENMATVIDGLSESEANHCQIEMNIIQQMQAKTTAKKPSKRNEKDVAFM